MQLSRVPPETYHGVFVSIAEKGFGRTADLLRAVLRSALNRAVKLRRLEVNPILGTEPVRYMQKDSGVFTDAEVKRFLVVAEDARLGCLFVLCLSLGLRIAEALGLRAGGIDLATREIHIRRQLQRVKLPGEEQGRWIEREPKKGSLRDLPIPEPGYRFLVRHLAKRAEEALAAGEKWTDSGFLFVNAIGGPLHEKNVAEEFHATCDRAKVPRIRFHDTRHSCGTFLHAQGADSIMRILGHSQLSTTKRYTHVSARVVKPALDRVDSLFQWTQEVPQPDLVTNSANHSKAQ